MLKNKQQSEVNLTERTLQALTIVAEHPGITPANFAHLMWPASEKWKHSVRCGVNGVSIGGGMRLAAGGYLGKLYRRGLIGTATPRTGVGVGYALSVAGREALSAAKGKQGE